MEETTLGESVKVIRGYAFCGCRDLCRFNYEGTADEWEAVEKSYFWDYDMGVESGSYTVYCSDGRGGKSEWENAAFNFGKEEVYR